MPWLSSWPATAPGTGVLAEATVPGDVAESFMRQMIGDDDWARLSPATRDRHQRDGSALVADLRSLEGGAPWDGSAITIPVVVGTGGESGAHYRWLAEELASTMPEAEVVCLPEAPHAAHYTHPSALASLLRHAAMRARAGSVTSMDEWVTAETSMASLNAFSDSRLIEVDEQNVS